MINWVYNDMGNSEETQMIKNQGNHGTGSDMEIWREKHKACYQQPWNKH